MPLLLVHEPVSLWTAEIERAMLAGTLPSGRDLTVRWRPYWDDLVRESELADLAVLVLDASVESLDAIDHLQQSNPGLRIVCLSVGDDGWDWERAARMLGADVVLPAVVQRDRLLAALGRLLTRERAGRS